MNLSKEHAMCLNIFIKIFICILFYFCECFYVAPFKNEYIGHFLAQLLLANNIEYTLTKIYVNVLEWHVS